MHLYNLSLRLFRLVRAFVENRRHLAFLFLLMLPGGWLFMSSAASAAVIDFTATKALVADYASVVLETLVAAALGWAMRYFHLAGNASAELAATTVRVFLHETVDRAIQLAVRSLPSSVTVEGSRGLIVQTVATYVQSQAPGALKKLGVSTEQLKRLIEAKLADWLKEPALPVSFGAIDLNAPKFA